MHPMGRSRSEIVSAAASHIRTYIRSLAAGGRGLWTMGGKDLEDLELRLAELEKKEDPRVAAAARNIAKILSLKIAEASFLHQSIHFTLFGKAPWEVSYGPEECPLCGCSINELGFCCCAGAVD